MDTITDSIPSTNYDKLGRKQEVAPQLLSSEGVQQAVFDKLITDELDDDAEELAMLRAIGVQAKDLKNLMSQTSAQAEINARNRLEEKLLQRSHELEILLGLHRKSDRIKEARLLIDKPFIDVSILRDDPHPEHLFGVEAWTGWLEARAYIAGLRIGDMTCQSIAEIHKKLVPGRADIIGGRIRSKRVLGSANGEELELGTKQRTAIDSNPLLVFKNTSGESNKGYIVYPSVEDSDSLAKCISYLGPEYADKLSTPPNTEELVTLLMEKVLSEYKEQMQTIQDQIKEYPGYKFRPLSTYIYDDEELKDRELYKKICGLAAKFQRLIVSIHPFADANGRLSRLLLYSIFHNLGSNPPIIPDWDQDLFFSEEQWVSNVMDALSLYAMDTQFIKADYESTFKDVSTKQLCVDDGEIMFFDNYYSKICPLPSSEKRMTLEEYRTYLKEYRKILYEFYRDTTEYIVINKASEPPFKQPDQYPYWEATDMASHGGVVSETYISLFGDTRPDIQNFIREQYYDIRAPHLFRGCPVNRYELEDDPHEILSVFEMPVGIGASYRASLVSGDKQNSIQELPKSVVQTVFRDFNSMMLDNFARQNGLVDVPDGFDIEAEWSTFLTNYMNANDKDQFLQDVRNGATYLGWLTGVHQQGKAIEATLSPMISLSTDAYIAYSWTKRNVEIMESGAIIETLIPKRGTIYSPEAQNLKVIHEGWEQARGSYVNIPENEVMVAGAIDPNSVENVSLFFDDKVIVIYRSTNNQIIYADSKGKNQEIYAYNSDGKLELQKTELLNSESHTRINWAIKMMSHAHSSSYNHNVIPSYYENTT